MENINCEVVLDKIITECTYLVSTSHREMDFTRATTAFLKKRFKKNRFKIILPWNYSRLPQISTIQPKGGAAIFVEVDPNEKSLKIVGHLKIEYDKVQFCKVVGDTLWVLGIATLASYEVGNLMTGSSQVLKPKIFIQDNLLAGAHVFHIEDKSIYVSSSGCEGVLVFSKNDHTLFQKYLFKGHKLTKSYHLPKNLDLRKNYITNDFQKFHLNSCSKYKEKVFFTTLSGIVGFFNIDTGESKVIAEGYVGLHQISYDQVKNHLHMIQSTTGTFFCMDIAGKILNKHQINSSWVQSAISMGKCDEIIYVDTLNNQLVVEHQVSSKRGLIVFSLKGTPGKAPMFISKAII
jgi:hypothetical protein